MRAVLSFKRIPYDRKDRCSEGHLINDFQGVILHKRQSHHPYGYRRGSEKLLCQRELSFPTFQKGAEANSRKIYQHEKAASRRAADKRGSKADRGL